MDLKVKTFLLTFLIIVLKICSKIIVTFNKITGFNIIFTFNF